MSRLTVEQTSILDSGVQDAAAVVGRRVTAMPSGQCPVDFTLSTTRMYLAQSCGKCTPCRVGLSAAADIMEQIMEGEADDAAVESLQKLAQGILDTADCAIGYESAKTILDAVDSFEEDFKQHLLSGTCAQKRTAFVPCQSTCPAHVDIPAYVALVNEGRYEDALRVIRNDNPLPAICGYVCEHPCELSCRRSMVDYPVNICALKRFADDNAEDYPAPECLPSTGKSVGIIGGGPAGLTAAYYLQLMGHDVTIYDQRPKLGGMTRYGIPDYRLPQEKLDRDVNFILSTGVKAKTDCAVGIDISYDDILAAHDAVYLAIGAHSDKRMGIDSEDAEGVISAVQLLRAAGHGEAPDFTGKRVVIVGGGNVAMDCTRTAKRLNAETVECVYRRRIADMTALDEEIEEAMAEGCQITELQAPVRIEADADGKVTALVTQPQIIGALGSDGRPRPVAADLPENRIECDVVVVAIGQDINTDAFGDSVSTNRGKIVADPDGSIGDSGIVFAGGDAVSGPATVIRAIAAGKVAAANIDKALGFHHSVYDPVDVPFAAAPMAPAGRVNLRNRNFGEATQDFDLAKHGMTCEEAIQESSRCLRCDHHGFGAIFDQEEKVW